MADTVAPLATAAQLSEGPLADLVRDYSTTAVADLLMEATRMLEDHADRRLAPFTGVVESQRAMGLDVEDALDAYVPLDPTSQLGFSRGASLGSTMLVRHFWLREFPPRNPEFWSGSLTSVDLLRSFSGTQTVDTSQLQYEPDTGHVRFQLGTFVPPGTTIVATYSGGYSTVPSSLVRACKFAVASLVMSELDPASQSHDPDELWARATVIVDTAYARG
ncbi:hypothetical protein [Streptacidiphilus sp. EB129]|uniref:hypothetical protein n=1 Tax=Streptacidiphilus sp. EB129 TaxID=3156262 RepID=UPI00351943C4